MVISEDRRVNDGYNNDDDLDTDPYRFETNDNPTVSSFESGDNIEYYLNFAARVLDSGRGWTTIAEKADYWVKFEGKYRRRLTYGGFN